MIRPQPGTDTRVFGLSSTLTIAAAISDGSTGFCAADGDVPEISSVLVNVGSTALTLTPCGANSSAIAVDSPDYREFSSDVDDLTGHRHHAGQRCDVDDVPAAAFHHLRQRQLTAGEHSIEVDLDRRADRLRRLVQERTHRHDTGVVDQHVDVPTAVGAGLVQKGRERLPIGHVEGMAAH